MLIAVATPADTATPVPTQAPTGGTGSVGLGTLAQQAQGHYSRAVQAQREGDWTAYGEEITQLGDVLKQLQGTDSQN